MGAGLGAQSQVGISMLDRSVSHVNGPNNINIQELFNDGDVSMMDEMNKLVTGLIPNQ